MNRYQKIDIIGKGTFGSAWLVESRQSKRLYALKELNATAMPSEDRHLALNEVKILSTLKHRNIVRYRDAFEETGRFYIVMEYAEGGDLHTKIKQAVEPFSSERILNWLAQLLLALKHIHGQNILHRDLKTQNIFLTKDDVVKIGDFGIARILDSTCDHARTTVGTPYYLSPEICQRQPYNNKSDIWALGCVLYELTTRTHPFTADNLTNLVVKILHGNYPPIPRFYGPLLEDLVAVMLKINPADRPSAKQLIYVPGLTPYIDKYALVQRDRASSVSTISSNAPLQHKADSDTSNDKNNNENTCNGNNSNSGTCNSRKKNNNGNLNKINQDGERGAPGRPLYRAKMVSRSRSAESVKVQTCKTDKPRRVHQLERVKASSVSDELHRESHQRTRMHHDVIHHGNQRAMSVPDVSSVSCKMDEKAVRHGKRKGEEEVKLTRSRLEIMKEHERRRRGLIGDGKGGVGRDEGDPSSGQVAVVNAQQGRDQGTAFIHRDKGKSLATYDALKMEPKRYHPQRVGDSRPRCTAEGVSDIPPNNNDKQSSEKDYAISTEKTLNEVNANQLLARDKYESSADRIRDKYSNQIPALTSNDGNEVIHAPPEVVQEVRNENHVYSGKDGKGDIRETSNGAPSLRDREVIKADICPSTSDTPGNIEIPLTSKGYRVKSVAKATSRPAPLKPRDNLQTDTIVNPTEPFKRFQTYKVSQLRRLPILSTPAECEDPEQINELPSLTEKQPTKPVPRRASDSGPSRRGTQGTNKMKTLKGVHVDKARRRAKKLTAACEVGSTRKEFSLKPDKPVSVNDTKPDEPKSRQLCFQDKGSVFCGCAKTCKASISCQPKFKFCGETLHLDATDAGSAFAHMEALRVFLEERLGTKRFVEAYQYLIDNSSACDVRARTRSGAKSVLGEAYVDYLPVLDQLIACEVNHFGTKV
ncbi:STE20-like serine/threonine-protein kinase isoform X2 [Nematostella vectensis]|uniref:STE20-like serine/threonine-protein kinase isoform X2 n=1 Tax=Nematostella vectensis TaxID=45351 RepID=UPI0013902E1B|nr:STE20-like serine/threonine-protein kinase isoform X2 [Nematostella vectensis]